MREGKQMKQWIRLLCLWCLAASPSARAQTQARNVPADIVAKVKSYKLHTWPDGTVYVNCDKAIPEIFGAAAMVTGKRRRRPNKAIPGAIVTLAERLPKGGAIHLGRFGGGLDFRRIQDGILITGGKGGITLGTGQKGIDAMFVKNVSIQPGVKGKEPIEDLLVLGSNIGRINAPVNNSNFIVAVNAWARYGFVADAPINNSLFLRFSTNWTFADYNAHLAKPDPDWYKKNCQVKFDLKGGGRGTRIYLMVETNYGNPGVGVWLENCKGLALYHGATERGSSQGPGVYYLKNCEDVQLGVRRIFPGTRGAGSAAMPTHAVTIEGGRNNILHIFSDFANSYEESIVNSDPALQLWGASFDYEVKGLDSEGILKFAFTPLNNMPEGKNKEEAAGRAAQKAEEWIKARNRKSRQPVTPENIARLKDRIRQGRDFWWPINARHEVTFTYGGADLTKGERPNRPLPPPPSIPATNAPTDFRPLYYTWEKDFGKRLLDAGADPTGKTPSDDAFAKVMYGMSAAAVEAAVRAAQSGDKDALAKLLPPPDPKDKKKRKRLGRPGLDVPAGTFLLTRTLHLEAGNNRLVGAGPGKTTLKFKGDIVGLKQWQRGFIGNLTVDGGTTGLAITGADHHGRGGAFTKSYIAGQIYYNITFRNQSFAGIHVGHSDPAVVGGAEFDQNSFINLNFYHTGDYGIYMNNNMTDKWLCTGGEFVGQKKAGISINFNNLIHGGVFGATFKDIDGPGIDFMGGNPQLAFRPYVTMVDQCEFIECGNAVRPAVDYGNGELTSFTRCRIITRDKKVKHGLVGGAQHYEDVEIDVKLAAGGKALLLRGVRQGATARANGHILMGVKANGPLGFVNDANAYNALYEPSRIKRKIGKGKDIDWDVNPAAHALAPPNGWVHPYILYRCEIDGKEYAYTLLNAGTDNGVILNEVDLSGFTK